jgi:hypothetical protein
MSRKATHRGPANRSDAITDIFWSALSRKEPQSRRRKKAALLLILAGLIASGLYELWSSLHHSQPQPPASIFIRQDGGTHNGDNVIGSQTIIERAPDRPAK